MLAEKFTDPYEGMTPVSIYPLVTSLHWFDRDLRDFMDRFRFVLQNGPAILDEPYTNDYDPRNSFFRLIAMPMFRAWSEKKADPERATGILQHAVLSPFLAPRNDWLTAGLAWMQRLIARRIDQSSAQATT
jgi:hypothetical protein